ncbi:MAG: hypothetical protein J6B77_01600 [Clostridia bacterium]|nr:hypothetical protein [Clostridia bacterium]
MKKNLLILPAVLLTLALLIAPLASCEKEPHGNADTSASATSDTAEQSNPSPSVTTEAEAPETKLEGADAFGSDNEAHYKDDWG